MTAASAAQQRLQLPRRRRLRIRVPPELAGQLDQRWIALLAQLGLLSPKPRHRGHRLEQPLH